MDDPVLAGDGHSYERAAIESWLATHTTSPLTGQPLPDSPLIPNWNLKKLIAKHREAAAGRRRG